SVPETYQDEKKRSSSSVVLSKAVLLPEIGGGEGSKTRDGHAGSPKAIHRKNRQGKENSWSKEEKPDGKRSTARMTPAKGRAVWGKIARPSDSSSFNHAKSCKAASRTSEGVAPNRIV